MPGKKCAARSPWLQGRAGHLLARNPSKKRGACRDEPLNFIITGSKRYYNISEALGCNLVGSVLRRQ